MPFNIAQLPEAFTVSLEHISAISLTGEEQSKYLQGQVTCDVNALEQNKLLTGGHCDAKGKLFSVFRLVQHQQALLLVQPKTSIEKSLPELKKFGVFAKVDIEQTKHLAFYGVAGSQVENSLKQHFSQLPDSETPAIETDSVSLLFLGKNSAGISRYIIIGDITTLSKLIDKFQLPHLPASAWDSLEITAGFPILSANAVGEFVPQMVNLQAIDGISFTKGCYLGQETVARMQYLGKNKRALFVLTADEQTITESDIIEKQIGDNWRKAGDVLAVSTDDSHSYLQAVLASDINEQDQLRIKHSEQPLTLLPLPYTITASN